MFVRLDIRDLNTFGRGIAFFLCVVIIGLIVTEMQINKLTQWRESVRVCSIERDITGKYVAHLLGNQYEVHASYQIAKLANNDTHIVVDAGTYQLAIPTEVTIDSSDWLFRLENGIHWCWKQLRIGAGYLQELAHSFKPVVERVTAEFIFWIKSVWNFITAMLADPIQQVV